MKRLRRITILIGVLALVVSACNGDDAETTTAAPGDTQPPPAAAEKIEFWSTETQPERLQITQDIIAQFTADSGIEVELTSVDENALPNLMVANAAAGTLPDVVFHPIDFTVGWASQGLLDTAAANQVVDNLGRDTFAAGALDLATVDGLTAAVPSDGWGQLLLYRKDLFDAAGLATPDTFASIQAAAEALHDPGNNFFGITASNDASAVFTQQTFEHFALANNCQLTDDAGNVTLNSSECVEAIDFYTNLLANYSPGGAQDVVTTRETYFAGQAAMIVWSPFILDEMAGLRDAATPACDECSDDIAFLAKNSAIVPSFSGPSGSPAQYGQISYMGIATGANVPASQAFIEFWLSDGYVDWLSTSPEGKFPMRRGNADNATEYVDGWSDLETGVDRKAKLTDFYSTEVIDTLIEGTSNFSRWGFLQGQGELVTAIYSSLPVPRSIAAVLEGTLSASDAADEMQADIEEEKSFLE